jgi:hypothetical protein
MIDCHAALAAMTFAPLGRYEGRILVLLSQTLSDPIFYIQEAGYG